MPEANSTESIPLWVSGCPFGLPYSGGPPDHRLNLARNALMVIKRTFGSFDVETGRANNILFEVLQFSTAFSAVN